MLSRLSREGKAEYVARGSIVRGPKFWPQDCTVDDYTIGSISYGEKPRTFG